MTWYEYICERCGVSNCISTNHPAALPSERSRGRGERRSRTLRKFLKRQCCHFCGANLNISDTPKRHRPKGGAETDYFGDPFDDPFEDEVWGM